jgi:hypothetical protein
MSDKIVNIQNPVPILKQEKSSIITNPFIPNEQKQLEIQELDKEANQIMEIAWAQSKSNSIANLSLNQINKNVSLSVIGFLDDLFSKPKDISWKDYLIEIIQKEQRYTYIGVLFILIAIYMLFLKY